MTTKFEILKAGILERSEAQTWDGAKLEWRLTGVYEADEPQTCLCSHFPIIEVCEIANSVTGENTEVGNCCVKKFFGFSSDGVFRSIKAVRKTPTASLGSDAIVLFHQKGIINDWERKFLADTFRKRSLTMAQQSTRVKINEKVLRAVKRRGLDPAQAGSMRTIGVPSANP